MPLELMPGVRCRCCGVRHNGVRIFCPYSKIPFFMYL